MFANLVDTKSYLFDLRYFDLIFWITNLLKRFTLAI